MDLFKLVCIWLSIFISNVSGTVNNKPNIVFIFADDLVSILLIVFLFFYM